MTVDFKELARVMIQGWCDQLNDGAESYSEEYYKKLTSNEYDATILAVMGHWGDDLLSIFAEAPHIRLTAHRVDNKWVVVDVPEPPSGDYYWERGGYRWSKEKNDMVYSLGEWVERKVV